MKCNCIQCKGEGRIVCPDCDGRGTGEVSIQSITLEPGMDHFEELRELQKDAHRVQCDAEQLKLLRPDRADSYEAQLQGALFIINGQADAVTKQKAK